MLAIPLYQTWARETRSSECVCLLLCGDIPCKAVPKNARNSPRGSLDMWQCDLQWSAGTSSDIGCTLHLTMCAVLLEWILAISWNPYYSNRRLPCSSKPIWQEVERQKDHTQISAGSLPWGPEVFFLFLCWRSNPQPNMDRATLPTSRYEPIYSIMKW